MDSPMLAERGWCTAGSSRGKRTDTSGCSGGKGRGGAERGGVEGGGGSKRGKGHPQKHEGPQSVAAALCRTESLGETQSERDTGRDAKHATLPTLLTAAAAAGKGGEKENIFAARWPLEAARDSLCAVIIVLDSDPRAVKCGQQVFVIPPHGHQKKKEKKERRIMVLHISGFE